MVFSQEAAQRSLLLLPRTPMATNLDADRERRTTTQGQSNIVCLSHDGSAALPELRDS
jgi:hypothetical protein